MHNLSLIIAPPCGRANTATLKLAPYCHPCHVIIFLLYTLNNIFSYSSIFSNASYEQDK